MAAALTASPLAAHMIAMRLALAMQLSRAAVLRPAAQPLPAPRVAFARLVVCSTTPHGACLTLTMLHSPAVGQRRRCC